MAKKYQRFRALIGGDKIADEGCAFEVESGKIITHSVTEAGFFRKKFNYAAEGTQPITRQTTVKLSQLFPDGSGMCDVVTGESRYDYHVYKDAELFVKTVQWHIDQAPQ